MAPTAAENVTPEDPKSAASKYQKKAVYTLHDCFAPPPPPFLYFGMQPLPEYHLDRDTLVCVMMP